MTKKTRRKIDAVLKAKIALEALREQATVTELATLDAGRLLAFEDFDLREECWTCATAELRGTSKNCPDESTATKPPSIDSGSFSVRFGYVHEVAAT